jgi:protein SCO1/2
MSAVALLRTAGAAAAAALSLVLAACAAAPTEVPPGPRADYFPNLVLRTQDDRPVRFYDDLLKRRIVVINVMYTSCDGV